MKTKVFVISALSIMQLTLLPFSAWAQGQSDYFALKGGAYRPTGDLDDAGFDTGFNGEVVYGHDFAFNFGMEVGVGYFKTDDLSVPRVTLTGKWSYPVGNLAPFIAVGLGVYQANFDGILTDPILGNIRIDDDDSVFGVHLGLGANYNITDKLFLGVEGKYIVTDEVDLDGTTPGGPQRVEFDLDGFMVTGNIGFRF